MPPAKQTPRSNKVDHQATVFVDADNTLWETDGVYARAQLALLSDVESVIGLRTISNDRLFQVRDVDQAIAERHHGGLRYPPRLLAQALALMLTGSPQAAAIRRVLRDNEHGSALTPERAMAIEAAFMAALKETPAPRLGVSRGLALLHSERCLILIVTEGARDRVTNTAEILGLSPYVTRVIEAAKVTQLYRRVARLSHAPLPMFMVGDQLQRDIAPAKAAGLRTVYFPSGFRPRWEPSEDAIQPDYRISNFEQVPALVKATLENRPWSPGSWASE